MPAEIEIPQFPYSHFNEKARWALDWKRVEHTRRNLLPGPHVLQIRRLTGATKVPVCRQWSVSLASGTWESIDFATRQSSLNGHQAMLGADGVFRGLIAQRDPGVPNWLDPAGHESGSLAIRFLLAESPPGPTLARVPFAHLRDALPADTPRVDPAAREQSLLRRRRAALRRYRR